MQADEFEKKIQNKMEEFGLVPGSEVWKQVSIRIEKEKKKRRALLFLLFTGFVLLSGTSILWLINNENNKKPVTNYVNSNTSKREDYKIKKTLPNSSNNINKISKAQTRKGAAYFKKDDIKHVLNPSIKKDNQEKVTNTAVAGNVLKKENKMKKALTNSSFNIDEVDKPRTKKDEAYIRKDDIKHAVKRPIENDNKKKITNTAIANNELNVSSKKANSNIYHKEKSISRSLPVHKFYNPNATFTKAEGTLRNEIADGQTPFKKEASSGTIAEQKVQLKGKINKKFNFGFTVYSGISNNLSGIPIIEKSYAQNYTSSPTAISGGYNSGGSYRYINTLSNFSSGLSFGLGFFVQKQFAKRLSVSAGAEFHSYSAKSAVGSKVNLQKTFYDSLIQKATSVNSYYTIGNSSKYSNKYQLIELPLNFWYQLNKDQKKPLLVVAGVSPGYMAGTNALYANPFANTYYVDKEIFHHFQFSSQAGFSFPIIASSRYLLSAGPVIQYGFTNTAKATTGTSQHLFFTGIKANIILR